MSNDNPYYYHGPALRDFSGFLNYVDADRNSDKALVLSMRLDVSHNRPSEAQPNKKYTDKGESPFYRLKIYNDHEAFGVIDELIASGKVVDGKAQQGVKLYVTDAFIRTHFWTKVHEKYGPTIFMQGTLSRGAKLSTQPIRRSDNDAAVEDAPVTKLDDPVDF